MNLLNKKGKWHGRTCTGYLIVQEYIFDINIDQISLEIKTYHNFHKIEYIQDWIQLLLQNW